MKKLTRFGALAVMMLFLLNGCSRSQGDEFSKVHKMLAELDTYKVTAEIIVRGNKSVESYVVRQYFKYPDRYRLEVLSPEDKKGKVTLYDGKGIWIYHPLIDQLFVMENLKEVEETNMFPGHFAKNLFCGEGAVYEIKKDDSDEYAAIKADIPGGNSYRESQVIYVDLKKVVPVKMEILNESGDVVVTVHYREFFYNEKLDDRLFNGENIRGFR